MKNNRKNKNLSIVFLALALIILTACTSAQEKTYSAGSYLLSGIVLDGQKIDVQAVYPQGAFLLLAEDGSGVLILGEQACEISWSGQGNELRLKINDLNAVAVREEEALHVTVEELGLEWIFTEGEAGKTEIRGEDTGTENTLQKTWNGEWSGRMWFEEGSGEWADYELRTMAVKCLVSVDASGEGEIALYNDFYSDLMPMAQISVQVGGEKNKSASGWFMSYPVREWDVSIEMDHRLPSEIEDTIIMHPDVFEYGHMYFSTEEKQEEQPVRVLSLKGKCEDEKGSFSYKILLAREGIS